MRSWVIGSSAECDLVVQSPLISGRHCRLTQAADGLILEDLGSTNGTYVDGNRITAAVRIRPAQELSLGQTIAMPWPSELAKFIRIGRVPGNEIVLDDARVSSRHARLMLVPGFAPLIEDLGSSNGTFLNSVDARVTRLTSLATRDTVYFGSLAVPAATLLAGFESAMAAPAPPPRPERRAALPLEPAVTSGSAGFMEGNRWLLAALAQAPLLALLIVLFCGRAAASAVTEANWAAVGQAISATSFAAAAAAVWLGCSLAVAELAAGLWPLRLPNSDPTSILIALGSRLAVLVAACVVGCVVLLAIVYWGAGFQGPWLAILGVLVMASTVSLLLGLLLSTFVKSWQALAAGLLGCFMLMTALGGWFWPARNLPASLVCAAMPTRWAFEGVLLLESPYHASREAVPGAAKTPGTDLAEDFFPADSERMGTAADVMALGSMLIGMAAAVGLASTKPT